MATSSPAGPQVVFAFSGQGSQTYHMGQALYQQHPVFREWMHCLDDKVRRSGGSVLKHLYSPEYQRSDAFDDIRLTHPAIFMVEYAMAQVMKAEGVEPDAVVGASLGEYCAAVLAGLMSLDDAIECIVGQAEIFHRCCQTGGMLAVLAPSTLHQRLAVMREHTEIASFNYDSSFVVAGRTEALDLVQKQLSRDDTVSQRLPVRQAFHSALMDAAKTEVEQLTRNVPNLRPTMPCISCTTATAVESIGPQYFWDMVRKPIQASRAIAYLEAQGSHLYFDLGPGGTFANFVRYNSATRAASRAYPLLTPFGRDMQALATALSALNDLYGACPAGERV